MSLFMLLVASRLAMRLFRLNTSMFTFLMGKLLQSFQVRLSRFGDERVCDRFR